MSANYTASGSTSQPAWAFDSEQSLGWIRSNASTMQLSYGTLIVPGHATAGANIAYFGIGSSGINYINLDGLRISGDDVSNTIYNASQNIGITRNSGGSIFIGQQGTPAGGIAINTTTGASLHTDGTTLAPSMGFSSNQSLGWFRSGIQTIAQSLGTFNLATNAVRLSMRTIAASALTPSAANTNVAVDEVVFTIQASGASFAINSGGTTWIFHSDASAKNT